MNQEEKFLKMYIAFRSGCLGNNVLDVYFSFFANILLEKNIKIINAKNLCEEFEQRYQFSVPITFVRQVLSVGLSNSAIISDKGQYEVDHEKLKQYKVDLSDFELLWKELLEKFNSFCTTNSLNIINETLEDDIL